MTRGSGWLVLSQNDDLSQGTLVHSFSPRLREISMWSSLHHRNSHYARLGPRPTRIRLVVIRQVTVNIFSEFEIDERFVQGPSEGTQFDPASGRDARDSSSFRR